MVEKDASDQGLGVEDSLTPKKRSYAQMMASSPNSKEARNSAGKEGSNNEVTPDNEGSKSHLKRLKVMEPVTSHEENKESAQEKAEEFIEPAEVTAPVTENQPAEESKYETAI